MLISQVPIILGSTSVYRKRLLSRLGYEFTVVKPDCDEDQYKNQGLKPSDLAQKLALLKAQSVAKHHPESIVIGCDQVADLDNQILSKPGTLEKNFSHLNLLQGKTHQLHTAMTLIYKDQVMSDLNTTSLTMKPMNSSAIEAFLTREPALDCAGGYKLESLGISLFEKIESTDWTAIEGLSLLALSKMIDSILTSQTFSKGKL